MSEATFPLKETLPQLIRRALAEPRAEVFMERAGGNWAATSSEKTIERVENLACAIRDAGLGAGDRVALIAHDCVDWIVCDFATFFAGCVVVPIYPTQAVDHTDYILKHSGSRLVFIDSDSSLHRLQEAHVTLPDRVVIFQTENRNLSLEVFETRGAALHAAHPELPHGYEIQRKPDDLAVLIYTSGTTGVPKGVMLSHDNLGFDAQSALECGFEGLLHGGDVISVLPYSHIYEHTIIYIYLLAKMRYFICHDPAELLHDLQSVRPLEMTSVPRIFDRVLAGVTAQAIKHGGLQARLVPWALAIGRRYMQSVTFANGASPALVLQYALAKRLVFPKIRNALGLDRIAFFTSGSAALHVDSMMTYLALGLPIMQGYGLTETSPVITVSRLTQNRYGSVGKPIAGTEVRIAPDGEILTRGRNVMLGYYNDPEATAATLQDGWLHTGDIGEVDSDGFLRITDRKKEIFKTATGKFVAPARVESAIRRSIFVSQAMVVGDGKPYPVALISPHWDLVRNALDLSGDLSPEALAQREDVRRFVTEDVLSRTADLATFEQIRKIVIVSHEFTVEAGELSPSMKIKRRVVEERYRTQIDALYHESGVVAAR
jgi:long-chain acyl-CoA synthetase